MRDGMDRQEYITYALSQIDDDTVWCEIEKELSAHIDDREQYYREIGYDDETAAQKAMEHMGSPEAAADGFSKVHQKSRIFTVILAVLSLPVSVLVFLCFWLIFFYINGSDSIMGLGIAEAMFLMYIIGLSVIGKRRNSRFICSVAIIDFVVMYGLYLLFKIVPNEFDELCSCIVLKLACLLTFDFECLSAFWQVGGITVAPYLTYLSIAFYAVIFVLLILVPISIKMLKMPTYGLRTKQFAVRVFKAQKMMLFFMAATMLILPVFGPFDKQAGMTVKTNEYANSIIIAQSDTPRPIFEIPPEDIIILGSNYDWSIYIFEFYNYGHYIEKECGNKIKYKVKKFDVPYSVTKKYVYIELFNEYKDLPNVDWHYATTENVYAYISYSSDNWYEVDSIGEITAAIDAYNQVEIAVSKADEKM